ncbi:melanocortin receptor 4-like [Oculina patagonica]
MANVTEDGNHTTVQQLFCPTGRYGVHLKILISALNIPLCITAFLGNLLIIVALRKTSSVNLRPPSKFLFGCLASTDLCVGVITQPLYVIFLLSTEHSKLCVYAFSFNVTIGAEFCVVSLLTMTAISVDRLLVLLLELRYQQVVTLRRVRALVVTFWLLCTASAFMLAYHPFISVVFCATVFILSIATSTFSYSKIYRMLRHHQADVHVHQGPPNRAGVPLNIARYRKIVTIALWLQMTLVACYVPFGTVAIVEYFAELSTPSVELTGALTFSLLLLNSTLNPFLYCWKMREVRQAAKDTIRQLWCFSS